MTYILSLSLSLSLSRQRRRIERAINADLFTLARDRGRPNAIASVRPSVRLYDCIFPLELLNSSLTFDRDLMHSCHWIEGQGQTSLGLGSQFESWSVGP